MTCSDILVLNPDARLAPDSVVRMRKRLHTEGVGIVAPRVNDDFGHLQLSLRREPTLLRALGLGRTRSKVWSEYVHDPRAYDVAHRVDWALGAVLLIARECHSSLNGWDETYFLYSEETDFSLRASDAGYETWFEPAAIAVHIGGQSGQSDSTHAMQIVNRVRLYSRRHSRVASYAYLGLAALSELSWWARGHSRSRFAVKCLLVPPARPAQLGANRSLLPA